MNGRFLINRRDAKVMGVAAGLADYTGVDPTDHPPRLRRADPDHRPGDDPASTCSPGCSRRTSKQPALALVGRRRARRPARRRFAHAQASVRDRRSGLAIARPRPRSQVGAKAPDFTTTGAVGGKAFKLHLARAAPQGPGGPLFLPQGLHLGLHRRSPRVQRIRSATSRKRAPR